MNWNDVYEQVETVWGAAPDRSLMGIAPKVPPGKVVDLGMGEGRNLIPFALKGYETSGFDLAPAAVQKCLERAQSLNLTVDARVQDIREVALEPESLSLVISTMALQFLKPGESQAVLERIRASLKPGGFVYLTVFSTEDPWYGRLRDSAEPIEPRTYFVERLNGHVHFFEREEILTVMDNLRLHLVSNAVEFDPGHPGVPHPHYHGILTYIGQRES